MNANECSNQHLAFVLSGPALELVMLHLCGIWQAPRPRSCPSTSAADAFEPVTFRDCAALATTCRYFQAYWRHFQAVHVFDYLEALARGAQLLIGEPHLMPKTSSGESRLALASRSRIPVIPLRTADPVAREVYTDSCCMQMAIRSMPNHHFASALCAFVSPMVRPEYRARQVLLDFYTAPRAAVADEVLLQTSSPRQRLMMHDEILRADAYARPLADADYVHLDIRLLAMLLDIPLGTELPDWFELIRRAFARRDLFPRHELALVPELFTRDAAGQSLTLMTYARARELIPDVMGAAERAILDSWAVRTRLVVYTMYRRLLATLIVPRAAIGRARRRSDARWLLGNNFETNHGLCISTRYPDSAADELVRIVLGKNNSELADQHVMGSALARCLSYERRRARVPTIYHVYGTTRIGTMAFDEWLTRNRAFICQSKGLYLALPSICGYLPELYITASQFSYTISIAAPVDEVPDTIGVGMIFTPGCCYQKIAVAQWCSFPHYNARLHPLTDSYVRFDVPLRHTVPDQHPYVTLIRQEIDCPTTNDVDLMFTDITFRFDHFITYMGRFDDAELAVRFLDAHTSVRSCAMAGTEACRCH